MSVSAINRPAAALDHYRTLFAARSGADDALTALRRAALQRFLDAGFPTQRDEAWKYTSLRRLEMRRFTLADAMPVAIDESHWIANAGHRLALVNGRFMPGLSAPQPSGVTIRALGEWARQSPVDAAQFLAKHNAQGSGAFEHLNGAFSDDGILVDIGADVILDQPLYIVHHWRAATQARPAQPPMAHPRIIVRAGRNSRCTIIMHYTGDAAAESLTNAWNSFEVESGAHVAHLRLQEESMRQFHIGMSHVHLGGDARFSSHDFALGGALGRSSTVVQLMGSGAEVSLNGLFAPTASQHLDTYVRIEHAAAHTNSRQDFRGIAAGHGRGVFNGKVIVHAGAQKTDAHQSNRNLLLSATAEIDSRPELEIYADDVQCSHGATTGQLDAASLFYLRSRGLSESAARALLIRAFAQSMLATVPSGSLRAHLEERMQQRFDLTASVIP